MVTFTDLQSRFDPDLREYGLSATLRMAALAAAWRAKGKGGRLVPAWRDFDIRDFRSWYGMLLVTDHSRPDAPFCKLYGSMLADVFGADFTGRHPADLFGDQRETVGRAFATHLNHVVRERKPGVATFGVKVDGDAPTNSVLSLPLAGGLVLSAFELAPVVRSERFDPVHAGIVG